METNFIQHVAKNKGSKINTRFSSNCSCHVIIQNICVFGLGRIESTLDAGKQEEQHGFRAGTRIEEHLLTTNLVLDKTLALDVPAWIVSLDLSKAFDKVKWENLWEALSILYQGRRATRMCIESAVVLVCSGGGPWMLASEGWQCWRGFSKWHAHTLGSKIRPRYFSLCKNV